MSRCNSKTKQTFKRFTLQVQFIYNEQRYVNRKSGNSSVQNLTLRKIVTCKLLIWNWCLSRGKGWLCRRKYVPSFAWQKSYFIFKSINFLRLQLHQLNQALSFTNVGFPVSRELTSLKMRTKTFWDDISNSTAKSLTYSLPKTNLASFSKREWS